MTWHRYITKPPGASRVWTLLAWVCIGTAAVHSQANDGIRLYRQAQVTDSRVRLDDVAELIGDTLQPLGNVVIAVMDHDDRQVMITHHQVRQALDPHDINWGRISVRGYAACRVVVRPLHDLQSPNGPTIPLETNPIEEVTLSRALTLRDRVIEFIEQHSGIDQADLQVTFAANDAPILDQIAWQDRYEFQPLSSTPVGRVPIIVRRYRNNQLADTLRVTTDVARRYLAVVAKQSVSRGQTFAPSDVEIREVYLDGTADEPLTDLSRVIGQTAGTVVRAGAIVHRHQLQSPLLVRRGQLVTVRCINGGLVVKTVARATEDGSKNQVIHVRADRSRQTYPARVTGSQEVVVMTSNDTDTHKSAAPNAGGGS